MNRSIALFVALVTLLAHTLAIHNDGMGSFAVPYDQTYVCLRLARNLVFENQLSWNPGGSAFESYPSAVWIGICAVGERIAPFLHMSMNMFVQTIGIVCSLVVLVLSAQFRANRIASLIAPLFLATSGCLAAAAANGLETTLFALTALLSFLALERGRTWTFALALAACCMTRPEGAIFGLAMLVLRLAGKPNDDEGLRPRVPFAAFLVPALVVLGSCAVRWRTTNFVLPPGVAVFTHPYPDQWREGVLYVRDFFLSSVSPLLLAFPAWYLLRGMLSRTGTHAIFVALVWTTAVVSQGRATLPFGEAMVPALAFLFIGAQEGMIVALDSNSAWKRQFAVVAFVVCVAGSMLASKAPGDLGPIPFGKAHERWMQPSGSPRFGYTEPLGRLGLQEEIAQTIRLRRVGLFLRDQIETGASVLSPWPGSIGYLSRQQVYDVLGRTDPLQPLDAPRSWARRERADMAQVLAQDVDYVVPFCEEARGPMSKSELARLWMEGLDLHWKDASRVAAIESALAHFELITVPVSEFVAHGQPREPEPFYLLRARRLEMRPRLEMRADGGRFHVVMFHKSHQQIAALRVQLKTSDGRLFSLRPTGEAAPSSTVQARTRLLLYDTGARGIELMRGKLPEPPVGTRWIELRAVLRNPEATGEDSFAFVSEEVVVAL